MTIHLVDELTIAPHRREELLHRLTSEYLPLVGQSGLRCARAVCHPPDDVPEDPTYVVLWWELDDVAALWKRRARSAAVRRSRVRSRSATTSSMSPRRTRSRSAPRSRTWPYRDRASFQEYMDSPYHWGVIEKWFDPTFPERIVDTRLAQVFYDVDSSLLSPAPRTRRSEARQEAARSGRTCAASATECPTGSSSGQP